jgi:putative acetyltransferase
MKNTNTTTGESLLIRPLKKSDWRPLWQYINQISQERTYISFQGEHVSQRHEQQYVSDMIIKMSHHQALVLILTTGKTIIGTAHLTQKPRIQNHVADLGISIHKDYRNRGLGRQLLTNLLDQGKQHIPKLKIVTLQLLANNQAALHLYQQLGFIKYGQLPSGHQHQHKLVDTILMYKPV